MLFKSELIEKIVKGEKTQTRRLIKYNGLYCSDCGETWNLSERDGGSCGYCTHGEVVLDIIPCRFKVGQDYAVQPGRGKPGVWWCPHCKIVADIREGCCPECSGNNDVPVNESGWRLTELESLRIRITGICKQRLCDITKEDAKAEGFESICEFLVYIGIINGLSKDFELGKDIVITASGKSEVSKWVVYVKGKLWNPEVWKISFMVV